MKTYLVKDTFKDKSIAWRDSDLDNYLAKELPMLPKARSISYSDLTRGITFKEIAKEFIGSDDIEKVKPHCFSLQEIEKMLVKKDKQLLTNGYSNIFFVESNGKVFGLRADWRGDWSGRGWYVRVRRFDNGLGWFAGYRFFSRNLDSGKLGSLDSVPELPLELTINGIKYKQV